MLLSRKEILRAKQGRKSRKAEPFKVNRKVTIGRYKQDAKQRTQSEMIRINIQW